MGKIRIKKIGIEELEKEQARRAQARRTTKKAKKGTETPKEEPAEGQPPESPPSTDAKTAQPDTAAETAAKSEKKAGTKRRKKVRSKRYKHALFQIDRAKLYSTTDALALVTSTSLTKFDGSVEAHIHLNPKLLETKSGTSSQETAARFRGTVSFPHGTGKQVRVAIADTDLIEQVKTGKIDFDVLVAAPDMMPKLATVAKILGPRGLMPNPKTGTIGDNPKQIAEKLSKGQVAFKTEPDNAIIHTAIGKVSFESTKLAENLDALITAIGKAKITKLTLAATMGPGVRVDTASL